MGWRATLGIGCCLLLLFYVRSHPALETPRQFAVDTAAVIYRVAAAPKSAFIGVGNFFQTHSTLRADKARLEQENLVLKGQTQKLAAVLAENGRYRALLRSMEGKADNKDKKMVREAFQLAMDAHKNIRWSKMRCFVLRRCGFRPSLRKMRCRSTGNWFWRSGRCG